VLERAGLSKNNERVLRNLVHTGTLAGIHLLKSLTGSGLGGTVKEPSFGPLSTLPVQIGEDTLPDCIAIEQSFSGPLSGTYSLLLPQDTATVLVRSVLIAQNIHESHLDEMYQEILAEVGNIILNACVSSLADALKLDLNSKTPWLRPSAEHLLSSTGDDIKFISAHAEFQAPCSQLRRNFIFILELVPTPKLKELLDTYIPIQN